MKNILVILLLTFSVKANADNGDVIVVKSTCVEFADSLSLLPKYRCDLLVTYNGDYYRFKKDFDLPVRDGDYFLLADKKK